MNSRIMQVVRESNLSFADFINQEGDQDSNFIYARIVVAEWRTNMQEAFDDALYTS